MTKVIFNKNAGRFHKGQIVDFQPALADFFVSKIRCADLEAKEDFSDVLGVKTEEPFARKTTQGTKRKKSSQYSRRDVHTYQTRDMRAAE